MYKCPDCPYSAEVLSSVSIHAGRVHKRHASETYVTLMCAGVRPTCKCGCGSPVRWRSSTHGFWQYVTGHNSRVDNPYNIPAVRARGTAGVKKAHTEGRIPCWNRGLTKETDTRVAEYGKSISAKLEADPVARKTRSERMRKGRLDGTIPSLLGPDHPQWRGGTSSLAAHCHGSHLYQMWKLPILRAAGFKCARCGSTRDLNVHHTHERMADIVREVAAQHGYVGQDDVGLKSEIARAVAIRHRDTSVPGEVLCLVCHGEEHPSLNFGGSAVTSHVQD